MLFPQQLKKGTSLSKLSWHGTLPVGKNYSMGKEIVKEFQDLTGVRNILEPSSSSSISPLQRSLRGKALMIIATYPSNNLRLAAIWSQLECFTENIDHVIIVAPTDDNLRESILKFMERVKAAMPEVVAKIETQFYKNDRYDSGLWCDSLLHKEILQKRMPSNAEARRNFNATVILGEPFFNRFDKIILINDSIFAVEHSNELLDTLQATGASLVSLNYWEADYENSKPFWVESVARVFSHEGIQIFADNICSKLQQGIQWRKHCPYLNNTHHLKRKKRCIVDITEVGVAALYPPNKVHGLYDGRVPLNMLENKDFARQPTWTTNYPYWSNILRDQLSFPAVKVSNYNFFKHVQKVRGKDISTCTSKLADLDFYLSSK
eukprot:CAMPEP_0176485182 /NCGR_PEP_ID=MMETSP0200_2-20121128/4905_1 /TAXON_ID=947934 /ORGANISM="Chaetoceros sp., Strain GSL56" /LENGTH=377 /DNA_ID=CAMNT_0017881813 /DNA_START=410 /DNA_END=1543 /DNA_ORIENTATION=-